MPKTRISDVMMANAAAGARISAATARVSAPPVVVPQASSSFCSSAAPKWMVYSAIALIGVLAIVLVFSIGCRYRETFAESKAKLVLVYKDGCIWCERFMPTWDAFATKYGNQIKVVKYEAGNDGAVISKNFQRYVTGYPTVLLVTNDERVVSFTGDRTEAGLLRFLETNEIKLKPRNSTGTERFSEPQTGGHKFAALMKNAMDKNKDELDKNAALVERTGGGIDIKA